MSVTYVSSGALYRTCISVPNVSEAELRYFHAIQSILWREPQDLLGTSSFHGVKVNKSKRLKEHGGYKRRFDNSIPNRYNTLFLITPSFSVCSKNNVLKT